MHGKSRTIKLEDFFTPTAVVRDHFKYVIETLKINPAEWILFDPFAGDGQYGKVGREFKFKKYIEWDIKPLASHIQRVDFFKYRGLFNTREHLFDGPTIVITNPPFGFQGSIMFRALNKFLRWYYKVRYVSFVIDHCLQVRKSTSAFLHKSPSREITFWDNTKMRWKKNPYICAFFIWRNEYKHNYFEEKLRLTRWGCRQHLFFALHYLYVNIKNNARVPHAIIDRWRGKGEMVMIRNKVPKSWHSFEQHMTGITGKDRVSEGFGAITRGWDRCDELIRYLARHNKNNYGFIFAVARPGYEGLLDWKIIGQGYRVQSIMGFYTFGMTRWLNTTEVQRQLKKINGNIDWYIPTADPQIKNIYPDK